MDVHYSHPTKLIVTLTLGAILTQFASNLSNINVAFGHFQADHAIMPTWLPYKSDFPSCGAFSLILAVLSTRSIRSSHSLGCY